MAALRVEHHCVVNSVCRQTKQSALPVRACVGLTQTPRRGHSAFLSNGSLKLESPLRTSLKSTRNHLTINCSVAIKESHGVAEEQGSERPIMEDTYAIEADPSGKGLSYFGAFDGHGGYAVAEFLMKNFWPAYRKKLLAAGTNPEELERATIETYAEIDQLTLAAPKGFFGMMQERGIGGSRCGACANTVVLLPGPEGKTIIVAANVGDGKTYLVRGGKAVQISVDHKPDIAEERQRIERKNPTPKIPLVRQVAGQWRVGGLLALSRAFGDAYLKDWDDGQKNGARGGFGLTAEPSIFIDTLNEEDSWAIIGTDGLWDVVTGEEALAICSAAGPNFSLDQLATNLLELAQSRGSTDDITVIVVRLQEPKEA